MRNVTSPADERKGIASEIELMIANAIGLVLQRPEVVVALRAALATKTEDTPRTTGLTKSELAKAVGVSSSTIDRSCKEDSPMPHHYVGDGRRFDLLQCKLWLASRGKKPTTSPKKTDTIDVEDVIESAGLRSR
jgi:hypothetical protein